MSFQPGQVLNTQASGNRPENIEVPVIQTRAPNDNDIQYPIGKKWIDTLAMNEYYLNNFHYIAQGSSTVLQAHWVTLGGEGTIISLQADDGDAPKANTGVVKILGNVVANATNSKAIYTQVPNTNDNIFDIDMQITAAIAATDVTKIGLAAFDSADFQVDANGFVQLSSSSVSTWNIITTSQSLVAGNGYFVTSGALVLTLPAGVKGIEIEVVLDGGTSWQIAVPTGVQIRMSSSLTTVTTGTITSTAQGDWIRLVAQSSTKWVCIGSIGNFLIT